MNGTQAKKLRKYTNRKINRDLEDMARVLSKEKFWWRFIYAIRIIFRWHPIVKFETKHNNKS